VGVDSWNGTYHFALSSELFWLATGHVVALGMLLNVKNKETKTKTKKRKTAKNCNSCY